jgi:hypothetical protein
LRIFYLARDKDVPVRDYVVEKVMTNETTLPAILQSVLCRSSLAPRLVLALITDTRRGTKPHMKSGNRLRRKNADRC